MQSITGIPYEVGAVAANPCGLKEESHRAINFFCCIIYNRSYMYVL